MPRLATALALALLVGLLSVGASPASADAASTGLQNQLDGMLTKVVGPGKGFVVVSENANLSRTTLAKLRYGRTGVALAGAAAKSTWQGTTSGTSSSSSARWANDQTITNTVVAPGAVKRLDVALVLDRSIPKAKARHLATAIGMAAGLRRSRGDRLTLLRVKLPPPPAMRASASPWTAALGHGAQPVVLASTVVAFMAFMAWTITRHRRDRAVTG